MHLKVYSAAGVVFRHIRVSLSEHGRHIKSRRLFLRQIHQLGKRRFKGGVFKPRPVFWNIAHAGEHRALDDKPGAHILSVVYAQPGGTRQYFTRRGFSGGYCQLLGHGEGLFHNRGYALEVCRAFSDMELRPGLFKTRAPGKAVLDVTVRVHAHFRHGLYLSWVEQRYFKAENGDAGDRQRAVSRLKSGCERYLQVKRRRAGLGFGNVKHRDRHISGKIHSSPAHILYMHQRRAHPGKHPRYILLSIRYHRFGGKLVYVTGHGKPFIVLESLDIK